MAGPAAILAVYARQSRKDPAAITRAIIKVQPKTAYMSKTSPVYHILVVTTVLSLPFVSGLHHRVHDVSRILPSISLRRRPRIIGGTLRRDL